MLVRTLGLADVEVREVRLTQVVVVVAVRLCEALWRPFVGSVYSGVGLEGAQIGCGGFLWGCRLGRRPWLVLVVGWLFVYPRLCWAPGVSI